jgi:hypothetical protein
VIPLLLLAISVSRLHEGRPWQGNYFPTGFFFWARRRSTALPPGAMDERDLALRNQAYVWAYNVLCILFALGLLAYGAAGWVIPKVLASSVSYIMAVDLPIFVFFLPDAMRLWLEPDYLEDSEQAAPRPMQMVG